MITVNSLSGGKTSSYIAANYPANYELFALVCIDDHNAGRKLDKTIKQMVNDRLQKYSHHWPEFKATSEDPKILTAMFDLEQFIGREIIWLRGMGWEEMIRTKKAIPNKGMRFCTTIMKMIPIFEFLYLRTEMPVKMRIGYRYDEMERADDFDNIMKYSPRCEYQPGSNRWIHRWENIVWRVGDFPLIRDKVIHYQIKNFWEGKGIDFPKDSNCQNCFWKPFQQLRKNFDTNPDIMQWSKIQEDIMDRTFKKEYSLHEIERMGLQAEFAFGVGSGCQAGFCTD